MILEKVCCYLNAPEILKVGLLVAATLRSVSSQLAELGLELFDSGFQLRLDPRRRLLRPLTELIDDLERVAGSERVHWHTCSSPS